MNLSSNGKERRLLKVGYVVKPHGVKGALLLSFNKKFELKPSQKIYFNRKEVLAGPFEIKSIRSHKNLSLTEFKGISNVDETEKYRGFSVGIQIEALPENFYWTDDLTGCALFRVSGKKIGVVEEVLKTGANDVLVSGDMLIPVTKNIIESIDIKNKRIVIKEIPGLFE